jgi:hypothetical protein
MPIQNTQTHNGTDAMNIKGTATLYIVSETDGSRISFRNVIKCGCSLYAVGLCAIVCLCVLCWYFFPLCLLWFVSSCVTNCRLGFSGFQCLGVCMCLGLNAILVFPKILCVTICAMAVSIIATCVLLDSRTYMYSRSGRLSVVFNWTLCDLFVDACILNNLSLNYCP